MSYVKVTIQSVPERDEPADAFKVITTREGATDDTAELITEAIDEAVARSRAAISA